MDDKVGTKTGQKTKEGRDVYKTPEGESVSEKSVTIKFDDNAYVNAPSIHNGKQYTEDEIKEMLLEGIIKPTSRHDTLEEALEAARKRSSSLMKEGGMAKRMAKQMELFEPVERGFDEGGLMDEGGTVDPVSGNEVPPGSTQEEVRDDIPAQLSEGEFVFPADVVRYIGLEKLMRMRQEAKQGLAQMEAMGQMGNNEEATVQDDLPFDMYDLDVEDDGLEMQQGGFVPPVPQPMPQVNPRTGTYQLPGSGISGYLVPPAATTTGYTPYGGAAPVFQPTQFTGAQFQTATGTTNLPTFAETVGGGAGYDELRTYINDAGQTLQIPFKDGKPIYPIPEGYRPIGEQDKPKEQPTTVTPTLGQVQVSDTGGDDRGDDRTSSTTKKDVTGISYDSSKLSSVAQDILSTYGAGIGVLTEAFITRPAQQLMEATSKLPGVLNILSGGQGFEPSAPESMLAAASFGGVMDAFRGMDGNQFNDITSAGATMATQNYIDKRSFDQFTSVDLANIADLSRAVVDKLGDSFKGKSASEAYKNAMDLAEKYGIKTTYDNAYSKNNQKNVTTLMREIAKKMAEEEKKTDRFKAAESASKYAEVVSGKPELTQEAKDAGYTGGKGASEADKQSGAATQAAADSYTDKGFGGEMSDSKGDDGSYDGGLGFGP